MVDLSLFSKLKFSYSFRKYQTLVLSYFESHPEDQKFHIVSPPGSGKTIVGIELIRRLGKPAVIFSPTSTIQAQWKDKVGLFLAEPDKQYLDQIAATSPDHITLFNSYTYQLLSTPGENLAFIEEAALAEWEQVLFFGGMAATLEEAKERVATLKQNNPKKYRSEVAKYYKKIKQKYLVDPNFDGTQLLHANAKKLIDDLVAAGVKVIIMDESHHLLDYWALILRELLKRLDKPILIGLTATPPIGVEDDQLENYISLLGEVDFEVPTPAVVKEGNLAPYQDLVYFTFPTEQEKLFIKKIQANFDSFLSTLTKNAKFAAWLDMRFFKRLDKNQKKIDWELFFRDHVALSMAGIKYARRQRISIPNEIPIIEEMEREMVIEDWVALLGDYVGNYLLLSPNPEDHLEAKDIADVLQSFGFSVTEQGIRSTRSPADRILSLSESKNDGVINILKSEMGNIGASIRAVVITDFEQENAIITRTLSGTLPEGAGSAIRAYTRIVEDETTHKLEPILVTGTKVLVEVHEAEKIIPAMEAWRDANHLAFQITTKKTEHDSIVEVTGKGKDWKSSTYVRMVTALFEAGITKCLVGTRGLLAEGWDTLSLNTLIDLTIATTSMMVQQIRGRSLRINPSEPQKVANNWDVVCIEPHFEKGDQDFTRFIKKHSRFYGVTNNGSILKGFGHVDSRLYFTFNQVGFKKLQYGLINQFMLSKSGNRKETYDKWKIGEEYQNFEYSLIKLDPGTIKFKTAYTLRESLSAIFRSLLFIVFALLAEYYFLFGGLADIFVTNLIGIAVCSGILLVAILVAAGSTIVKYVTRAFIELPIDSFMLDIGKCVLKSLREAKFVDSSLSVDNVRVVSTPEGYYDIYLDYAKSQDTETFSTAVKECLSTVSDQRYIISRSEADIRLGFFTPIWWILRRTYGMFFEQNQLEYHPVPNILSTHRKYADIFALNWKEYVGGGELIYTRSEKGLEILLKLRKKKSYRVKRIQMKYWK